MKKKSEILLNAGIFLIACFVILCWAGFNFEAFLVDDNRTQWFPVMEHAYSDFFKTGKIPVYDFFQWRGFSIAGQGYYSIMNPLMLLSYILSHYSFISLNTIGCYIVILFGLGTMFFFQVCRTLNVELKHSLMLTTGYMGMSSFFAFYYWYYVFNNYMIIPLLFLVFLRTQGKKTAFFSCGVVLSFDILMGNIQYTCYHYMIYGLLCVVYIIFKKKNYLKLIFSNIAVSLLLSLPFLLLAIQAAGGFKNYDFHECLLEVGSVIFGALLPLGIFIKFGIFDEKNAALKDKIFTFIGNSPVMNRSDNTLLYNGSFMLVIFAVLIFLLIVFAKKTVVVLKNPEMKKKISLKECISIVKKSMINFYHKKIYQKDESHIFIAAVIIILMFFISFIKDGIAAMFLSYTPVIKNFRYLFKSLFVIQPLTGIFVAAIFPHIRSSLKKKIIPAFMAFAVIGIVNNGLVCNSTKTFFLDPNCFTIDEEQQRGREILSDIMIDTDKYRYASYAIDNGTIAPDGFQYYNGGFIRNFATTMDIYGLSGYEISISHEHFRNINQIANIQSHGLKMIGNTSFYNFLYNLEYNPKKTILQLKENSIKYLLVETEVSDHIFHPTTGGKWTDTDERHYQVQKSRNEKCISNVIELCQKYGIFSEIRTINENYDAIILKDIPALCTSDKGKDISVNSPSMDVLSFESDGSENFALSFVYNDYLKAVCTAENGEKSKLKISLEPNGNFLISNPDRLKGTITVSYSRPLCKLAFFFEIVITVLFVIVVIITERKKYDKSCSV